MAGARRQNLSIRNVKGGRVIGGFDIRNVSPNKARMIASAASKAAAKISPGSAIRSVGVDTSSTSGKATVHQRSKTTIGFSDIPQDRWDAIFKKKKKQI